MTEQMLPRSVSWICCGEMRTGQDVGDMFEASEMKRYSWEYTLISQPLPTKPINVENVTLQQLEKKVTELSKSLQEAETDRIEMQRKLEECSAEKDLCLRRLEVISNAHECRITEMHCVIAELTKKLRTKQENTILEEQEPEGSEISYQEGSVYNSEMNLTNPDGDCQTDLLDNCGQLSLEGGDVIIDDFNPNKYESTENLKSNEKDISKAQVEALQEEVLQLKAQIAFLQSEIIDSAQNYQNKEDEIQQFEKNEEKEICQQEDDDDCLDGNETTCSIDQQHFNILTENDQELNDLNMSYYRNLQKPLEQYETLNKSQKEFPKKAERIKLNCVSKNESNDLLEIAMLKEQFDNVNIVDPQYKAEFRESQALQANIIELNKKIERLQLELEQSKVHNTLLNLSLDESKEHCDHLYLLCGKYESNAVALQIALNCSDRAIEAYDVMLALLESKLAMNRDKNEESRKAVETVAKHLLDRLESEKNVCENSLGPWQNAFSIPDKVSSKPWTVEDDNRLRYHVSKLKGTRATVQNTIVNLESHFSDFYEKSRLALKEANNEKADSSEFALTVMMYEMLQIREENLNLRNRIDDLEKEKQLVIARNNSIVEDTLQQLQLQLHQNTNANWSHDENIEAEHAAITEQQLVEALSRESELKSRIQSLMAKNMSNDVDRSIRDLQKTNLNLEHQLEQIKRKYQTRIRKMEKKIHDLSSELGKEIPSYPLREYEDQTENYHKDLLATTRSIPHVNVPETTL